MQYKQLKIATRSPRNLYLEKGLSKSAKKKMM